ncbi:unnamed protein product [Phytophthora fragariaefolia]|uniref:Unnamed protein product n=1 Tax=Phytophthora fragariaefolia TaxID=1490495 RepID=A0A9W6WNG3_9STRA|nr:unnamed protein product [Phytophthora fragariaefolia]
MVLTRAQAAAQAAALATIQDYEPVTAIVELPGESRASEMPSGKSDQLAYLAQRSITWSAAKVPQIPVDDFIQEDGVRAQFGEAEAKISSIVDGIPTIIWQTSWRVLKGSMYLGEETSKLFKKMVQASCANTAASIKISLDAELLRSVKGMQHKIARCVEESTREYVQQLVHDLTTQVESQLEVRVQRALKPTQAELHLQARRQADATSILREQLQRHPQLSNTRERLVDEAAIKILVNEALHREVELAFECKREPQQMQITEEDRASFPAQINTTIELTVQAAATTVGDAIQTGDDEISPEDIELDRNICDAWRETYLDTQSSQDSSNEQISGRNQDQESQDLETTPSTHLQAPLQQAVAQRCNQTSDLYSNPANLVVVIQQLHIQSTDHTQRPSSARDALNSSPPPEPPIIPQRQHPVRQTRSSNRRVGVRGFVASLQQQVGQRAEAAAHRYSSRK